MTGVKRWATIPWVLLLGWAALIFFLSSQSNLELSPNPTMDWILRKSAHMFVYAVLCALASLSLSSVHVRRASTVALILTALYAASDEFHQAFVAGRSPLATDVLIDILGASIGLLALAWLQRRGAAREA